MKDFDINRIARLAMLKLEDEEKKSLQKDMEEIVSFAEKIAEAELGETEVTVSPTSLREDEVGASLAPEKILAAADETKDGFFFVPRVVE